MPIHTGKVQFFQVEDYVYCDINILWKERGIKLAAKFADGCITLQPLLQTVAGNSLVKCKLASEKQASISSNQRRYIPFTCRYILFQVM